MVSNIHRPQSAGRAGFVPHPRNRRARLRRTLLRGHGKLDGREDGRFRVRVGEHVIAAAQVFVNTGTRSVIPSVEGLKSINPVGLVPPEAVDAIKQILQSLQATSQGTVAQASLQLPAQVMERIPLPGMGGRQAAPPGGAMPGPGGRPGGR